MTKLNLTAAVKTIESTPKSSRGGVMGEFKRNIIEIFKAFNKPIALNQLKEAYKVATGEDVPAKKFADTCWLMSTKNSKVKSAVLKGCDEAGVYELI